MTIEKGQNWLERYKARAGKSHPFEKEYSKAGGQIKGDPRGNGTGEKIVTKPGPWGSDLYPDEGEGFLASGAKGLKDIYGKTFGSNPYSPIDLHDEKLASAFKNDVVSSLSNETGIDYHAVNEAVHQWAYTSNDHSSMSMSIQQGAAAEFGVPLSEWQKQKIEEMKGFTKEGLERAKMEMADKSAVVGDIQRHLQYAIHSDNQAEVDRLRPLYNKAMEELGKAESLVDVISSHTYEAQVGPCFRNTPNPPAAIRKTLRAMYDRTQEQFRQAGVTEIVLYRGVTLEGSETGKGLPKEGSNVSVKGNAIESWSSSYYAARRFGNLVVAMRVPVARILSTPRSGFGCLHEEEFVVLGAAGGTDVGYVVTSGNY